MDSQKPNKLRVDTSRGNWPSLILYVICGVIALYLVLPIFVILPISFSSAEFLTFPPPGFSVKWFQRYFNDYSWINPTLVSFKIAFIAMILSTVLGTLAAMALVRAKIPAKGMINALILSPMIIPVIILSIALYAFFAKTGLHDTLIGLIIGHSLLCIPFVVITVSASLKGFDETLEKAAMICGANRLKTFLKVTLPIIHPGMISGALFAFMISFDEIVISMFICGINYKTLPMKMWEGIQLEINPVIAAVSTLLICLSVILLFSVEMYRRHAELKKIGGK